MPVDGTLMEMDASTIRTMTGFWTLMTTVDSLIRLVGILMEMDVLMIPMAMVYSTQMMIAD